MKYIFSLVALLSCFSSAQPLTTINSIAWRNSRIFFYMPCYKDQPEVGLRTIFPRLKNKNPHTVLIGAPVYYDVQNGMAYEEELMRSPQHVMPAYMIAEDCIAQAVGSVVYTINKAHTLHITALLADWTHKLLSGTMSDEKYDDLCSKISDYYPSALSARHSDFMLELKAAEELLVGLAEQNSIFADNPTFTLASLTAWINDSTELIKQNPNFDPDMSMIDFFDLIIEGSKLEGSVQLHAEKCKQFAAKLDRVLELWNILEAVYMILDYEPSQHNMRPLALVASPAVCDAVKDIVS